jgi:hypothetical protein
VVRECVQRWWSQVRWRCPPATPKPGPKMPARVAGKSSLSPAVHPTPVTHGPGPGAAASEVEKSIPRPSPTVPPNPPPTGQARGWRQEWLRRAVQVQLSTTPPPPSGQARAWWRKWWKRAVQVHPVEGPSFSLHTHILRGCQPSARGPGDHVFQTIPSRQSPIPHLPAL